MPSAFLDSTGITNLPATIEILEQIGQGQYSEVRRGMCKEFGSIAVKCIPLEQLKREPRLISREVSILKQGDHPNIVKYYGCYKDKEFLYMTMELCEGGSLRQAIDNCSRIEETIMRPIIKQTLEALMYLHSKGIAHRDIKPENILFTASRQVKLVDFGLSRKLVNSKALTVVGTPFYIAPEMIAAKYTCQCDLWSVGVVMYYATVGLMPFNAESLEELFNVIRSVDIVEWGRLSPQAIDFIQNLTKRVPKDRLTAEGALNHPWILAGASV